MAKTFSLSELLGDRSSVATDAANARRDGLSYVERKQDAALNYREGEAAAYNDARKLVDAELRRLCNLFQNGALQISDFGIHL